MADLAFPKVLTPSEIADLLHIDAKTVRKWLCERAMVGIQLPGGDWRVLQPDFDAFIAQHRLQPAAGQEAM
jgi:excisionase family DNA binding protein